MKRLALPVWFSFIVLCILLTTASATRAASPTKPNVVMIVADDLGWADIGYHNDELMTPNLDRLATGGVRLEQYYVCPTCSPTRVGILAGRNPSRYDILGPIGGKSTQHLPLDTVTLPRTLSKLGYTTHISGKWHLGLQLKYAPRQYGFDTSYGYLHGQIDPYTHLYKFGDRTWHRNDKFVEEKGHATDLITDEAVRVVEQKHDKPFFLYVAYSVPHHPLKEPSKWTDLYKGKVKDPWRALFNASITHMDDGIGKIIAALERTGQRENTLVIFTSDNGGQTSWSSPKSQYNGSYKPHTTLGNNLPLRGWKGQLYDGGIRVPALANWPGKLPTGSACNDVLCEVDWMTTLVALSGAKLRNPLKVEGEDIWPQLTGKKAGSPRTLYWRVRGQSAIRHGDWKLIAASSGKKVELFNLADDPNEKNNLAEKEPRRVEALKKQLAQQHALDD